MIRTRVFTVSSRLWESEKRGFIFGDKAAGA
jgi:hypothetical protein